MSNSDVTSEVDKYPNPASRSHFRLFLRPFRYFAIVFYFDDTNPSFVTSSRKTTTLVPEATPPGSHSSTPVDSWSSYYLFGRLPSPALLHGLHRHYLLWVFHRFTRIPSASLVWVTYVTFWPRNVPGPLDTRHSLPPQIHYKLVLFQ